ncbi:hypothetical protein S2091_1032 [Solimicrobium silvestre]|uniref:Uncharacterized protein n=1 Tax=Solimicrobium silvestre TaxID=2099400 RepID=A0A2S9H359_9BURK|nr:hypothetical protein S2091_1032 [Solimicrobium silvestre]
MQMSDISFGTTDWLQNDKVEHKGERATLKSSIRLSERQIKALAT